jgi:acyl carrier protein
MEKKEIFNILLGHVKVFSLKIELDNMEITEDTYFVDMGASSCDRAEIIAKTLDQLSIKEVAGEILLSNTLGKTVEAIYDNLHSGIMTSTVPANKIVTQLE